MGFGGEAKLLIFVVGTVIFLSVFTATKGPTREGSSALLNVLFAVPTVDAQGEEFHQFAGKIFVRVVFLVFVVVKVAQHRRIFGNLKRQGIKFSDAHPS